MYKFELYRKPLKLKSFRDEYDYRCIYFIFFFLDVKLIQ